MKLIFKRTSTKDEKGDTTGWKIAEVSRIMGLFVSGFSEPNSVMTEVARFLKIKNISIYTEEEKTGFFALSYWLGDKPIRVSIHPDYEFLKWLRDQPQFFITKWQLIPEVVRDDIRQSGHFYLQQMYSDCMAVVNMSLPGQRALIHLGGFEERPEKDELAILQIISAYLGQVLRIQATHLVNQKLSEVSHIKNQILANVTHELKTPLNAILGFSESGLEDKTLSEATQDAFKRIYSAGQNLQSTVDSILELARIESLKTRFKRERLLLSEILIETEALFRDACERKNIELKMARSSKDIYIYANPDQIRTVMINVVANALKFTDSGHIEITERTVGEMAEISIRDTGLGIEDDKLHLVFEEFYQGDGSQTRAHGGTGLGLAIVKKIISLHGGRVWVQSRLKQGTQVIMTLPLYPI